MKIFSLTNGYFQTRYVNLEREVPVISVLDVILKFLLHDSVVIWKYVTANVIKGSLQSNTVAYAPF